MAKTTRNSDANQRRADRILSCAQCKGTPETAECNLQGIRTTYCVNCMEVINYTNQSAPIITTKKIADKEKERVTRAKENILGFSGKMNFQDLNLQ